MTREDFVAVAAQLWCQPKHGHKVMDAAFAYSIVDALVAAYDAGLEVSAAYVDECRGEGGADLRSIRSHIRSLKIGG